MILMEKSANIESSFFAKITPGYSYQESYTMDNNTYRYEVYVPSRPTYDPKFLITFKNLSTKIMFDDLAKNLFAEDPKNPTSFYKEFFIDNQCQLTDEDRKLLPSLKELAATNESRILLEEVEKKLNELSEQINHPENKDWKYVPYNLFFMLVNGFSLNNETVNREQNEKINILRPLLEKCNQEMDLETFTILSKELIKIKGLYKLIIDKSFDEFIIKSAGRLIKLQFEIDNARRNGHIEELAKLKKEKGGKYGEKNSDIQDFSEKGQYKKKADQAESEKKKIKETTAITIQEKDGLIQEKDGLIQEKDGVIDKLASEKEQERAAKEQAEAKNQRKSKRVAEGTRLITSLGNISEGLKWINYDSDNEDSPKPTNFTLEPTNFTLETTTLDNVHIKK